ncbi:hypothetical protein ACFC1B_07100 [Streptomyces xiamenensis]|uniref:hypothetical protein n=1 Tax=Streptomyces xiamenensis TaxID=408015 RepID=UPI0035DA3701
MSTSAAGHPTAAKSNALLAFVADRLPITDHRMAERLAERVLSRSGGAPPSIGTDSESGLPIYIARIAREVLRQYLHPTSRVVGESLPIAPAPNEDGGVLYDLPRAQDQLPNRVFVSSRGHWYHHRDQLNFLDKRKCRSCPATGRTPRHIDQSMEMVSCAAPPTTEDIRRALNAPADTVIVPPTRTDARIHAAYGLVDAPFTTAA